MSYDMNIYYQPEKHLLTVVAEWDYSDKCYQFDKRIVWRNQAGELLTARDSGCSCPSPFEDISLSDLTSVSKSALKEEAIEMSKSGYYQGDSLSEILAKIKGLK